MYISYYGIELVWELGVREGRREGRGREFMTCDKCY
jgi:hypothetical protein